MLQRILFTLVHGVLPVVLGILIASLGVLFVYLAIHLGLPILAGIGICILSRGGWQMGKMDGLEVRKEVVCVKKQYYSERLLQKKCPPLKDDGQT